jgi:hypothetical protein
MAFVISGPQPDDFYGDTRSSRIGAMTTARPTTSLGRAQPHPGK